ncbi:MAG: ImmA/IrrE family metallo-endopeptidase [Clostridiales bacterium]|nr:ImmA/IrrE family metallo-endopeptidase [Clostridiales bacterium]
MIYTREYLENLADSVNRDFFPERLTTPSVLDGYDLLEAIGCEYEWKYISPNDCIMGMTVFADGRWPIWPKGTFTEGDKPLFESFRKGTVIINQRLLDSKKKGADCSERFVVTHEASHWLKDKRYFEARPDSVVHTCTKNDFGKTIWDSNMTELEIIERQANYLGAAILMPRDVITESFFKAGRYKNIPKKPIAFQPYMKGWIAKIAPQFGMNYNPTFYRLKDLNVIYGE